MKELVGKVSQRAPLLEITRNNINNRVRKIRISCAQRHKWQIVDDVSLAFGHPVTINYVRPENVFFLNETGDNTHGKDNRNQGGQRKVVPRGKIPKDVQQSHEAI